MADKRGLSLAHSKDDMTFPRNGFSNWKKALATIEKHQNTTSHHKAVQLVKTAKNIGEKLSVSHTEQKAVNRQMLKIMLSNIRYHGRQGLALRGHYKTGDGSDKQGSLIQTSYSCCRHELKITQVYSNG